MKGMNMTKAQAIKLANLAIEADDVLRRLLEAAQPVQDDEESEYWKGTLKTARSCGIANLSWEANSRLAAIREAAKARTA